jgi:transposase-like protein
MASIKKVSGITFVCVPWGRQFIDNYEKNRGYEEKTKKQCLTMYVNGMGFRSKKTKSGFGQPLTTLKREF